ncbi:hypothetical protein HFO91_09815 [Rhizobium leguminosarum]|uniref:hypothetical protein n=1 Tax=Rhizobium leguminosarum TaxID=384 RepID=UPI001C938144|nr:hypothetical protein [Rhizobium leguminosarum]MBY5367397.1 hypothetical protein [Rhizobium leguminosarum]MBY5449957.1 hypothetical protein [Rhizobium leguminosarum]
MTYTRVNDFEQIVKLAEALVKEDGTAVQLNFTLQVAFDAELLKEPQLQDVSQWASDWQAIDRPERLYFSHGQYIGKDGVQYIVDELRNKPDSNRALISLISQKHLVGSGDAPIPSFMILQFSRVGETLYATAYFRALEVSKFFRINVEEIRQICECIRSEQRDIQVVHLTVHAFRAYFNPNINTLEVPPLDLLREVHILQILEDNPSELAGLIRDKKKHTTVIDSTAFSLIAGILADKRLSQKIPPHPNSPLIDRLLAEIIGKSQKLSNSRKSSSHHDDVQKDANALAELIGQLAEEFEKWKSA